ncbi:MAG: peptide-methionine (R)-S-oxide reductase [Spartobacteria bacterium]|nr:peptide-methionine (R)-S-oxide reductase [Spartobacteria bacterium]NCU29863.1 peptide-methionine (R)-S-oxide reductase [Candidatus Saccharibacteria bacterium]
MQNPNLSKAQRKVMFDKATEPPFTGKYISLKQGGIYVCANCGAKLFSSDNKYDSHCGWPSFDDSLAGAITYTNDTSHSMVRTEITCAKCGGHLGHVFDDGPPETTGKRYCVNSLSIDFTPKP